MQPRYWSILGACAALASAIVACDSGETSEPPPAGAGGMAGTGTGGTSTGGTGGRGGAAGSSGSSGAAGSSGASGSSGAAGSSGSAGRGGASGSGGSSTDAGADGAADGGLLPCAPQNVCDDFESYTAGNGFGPWTQNGTSGMLAVDQTHAFSGKQGVHFKVDAGGNKRVQLQRTGAPMFPAMNNTFWGRVMVWANNLPMKSDTEDKNVHYDIIQANSGGSEPGEYRVAGMGNVLLNYEPHDCYYGTNKAIPQDRWACWEWLFDGTSNTIEFYIDGQLQAKVVSKGQGCVDGTDSVWDAPTFNRLRMGWVNYQSKPATTDLWMDDFAAGPARIGCPATSAQTH